MEKRVAQLEQNVADLLSLLDRLNDAVGKIALVVNEMQKQENK